MVKKIQKLLPNLSDKDYKLGVKLLEKRDFESLQSLVNSALYKQKRKYKHLEEEDIQEYSNQISPLEDLKMAVDDYASLIDIPTEDYDNYFIDYD